MGAGSRSHVGDTRLREVLAAAAREFDSRGYSQTSMNEIADAVGLAKPTLYHYVSGKDEILYLLHSEFIDLLIEKEQRRRLTSSSAKEQIRGIMSDILGLMVTHRGHVRVFFENHRELAPASRAAVEERRNRYRDRLEALIREAIADGEFRKHDERLSALAIFGMCNWSYQWFRADGALSPVGVADVFADFLFRGLAGPECENEAEKSSS